MTTTVALSFIKLRARATLGYREKKCPQVRFITYLSQVYNKQYYRNIYILVYDDYEIIIEVAQQE